MIEVIEFEPGHLTLLTARWVFEGNPWLEQNCLMHASSDGCFVKSLRYNHKIVGVVGLSLLWPGVALAWTILGDAVKACPVSLHKTVKRLLDFAIRSLKLWRVHLDVRVDFAEGQRWAESLGFKKECIMSKYGPTGVDHVLYARVI